MALVRSRTGSRWWELVRQFSRIEAFLTEAAGSFDEGGVWATDGARTAASWLTARCHLPASEAKALVARARHLRHLPVTSAAFAGGSVGRAQVDALGRLDRAPTDTCLARDEALLVEQAKELTFRDLTRSLAYWDQFADPEGCEDRAEAVRCRRDVTLSESFQGTFIGTMTLDPLSGTIVADELDRLEQIFFEVDWAKAKVELGREPLAHQLARTPSQRRADALVEMATRSKMASATARRPTPLFTVMVDYRTAAGRVCELARGSAVTPGSLVPYLDEAMVERAVFSPDGRVEMSATQRFFTGATRRAIEVRDRICAHPLCELPTYRCQVDHIVPASKGGPSTQENGRMLCSFHNRLRNRRDDLAPAGDVLTRPDDDRWPPQGPDAWPTAQERPPPEPDG